MENALNYLKPDEIKFHISDGDLLMLSYQGAEAERVAVLRMFPFQHEEEYISVRKEDYTRADRENEIGIIRSLSDIEESQAEIIRAELSKRYFMPEITQVEEAKDEVGHTAWKVTTTAGKREFTVTDMSVNVKQLPDGRVMLTDVYGNRYVIPDISKLSDKVLKILEIWI